jgi:hypothetical protein
MKLYRVMVLLFALAMPLLAQAFDSYLFGERLVVVGDSAAKLADVAGQPAYKEPIENNRGAFLGERWEYRIDGKTVTFTISGGRVVEIREIRD